MNKPLMSITVQEDHSVLIEQPTSAGSVSTKMVDFDTFADCFRAEGVDVSLPMFPKGIRKYEARNGRIVVAIEYPAVVLDKVKYNGQEYTHIPVPASVWLTLLTPSQEHAGYYSIQKNHVYSLGAFGLSDENTTLKHWPFGNHSLGYPPGVCWGNDGGFRGIKDRAKVKDLSSLFSMYFAAEFNNDLSEEFVSPNGDSVFASCAGTDRFDESMIKSFHSERTLTRAMNVLLDDLRGEDNER